jgi:hypothetical protein
MINVWILALFSNDSHFLLVFGIEKLEEKSRRMLNLFEFLWLWKKVLKGLYSL